MSHQLSKRTGHVGASINGRREMHGEEPVPFMDISFSVLVSVLEAAKITGDTHLAERWFDTHDGKLAERALKDFKPFKLKGKFENSRAKLWVGVNALEIDFPTCRFASLSFDPQKVGSMVELKLKIQSIITNKNNEIFLWMDRDAEIELQFGELEVKELQQDLDLQVDDDTPDTAAEAIAQDDADQQVAEKSDEQMLAEKLEEDRAANPSEPKKRNRRRPSEGAALN